MSNSQGLQAFFDACRRGDVDSVREHLAKDPALARASMREPKTGYGGWTVLHEAAKHGQAAVVRLLLEHGADPNAREAGDNTIPLHWAAAHEHVEIVRALLDAGSDVHGFGDVHELEAIGWATYFHEPGRDPAQVSDARREVVRQLVDRGARHHIFSAISLGDLDLIRAVVRANPHALERRMSRFENRLTPLQFAVKRRRDDIRHLLIELGAEPEVKAPAAPPSETKSGMAALADSVPRVVPMIYVPDVARALDWYTTIGFTEVARFEDDGVVNFGIVSFGKAELMLNMHGKDGPHDVSLWFNTDQVDALYTVLKSAAVEFEQDIEDMFYGARQFGIRDLNGYVLYFIQSQPRQ